MLLGIHSSNNTWRNPQLTDSDKELLTLLKPGVKAAKIFSYYRLDAVNDILATLNPALVVIRHDDPTFRDRLLDMRNTLRGRKVVIQLKCEPNNRGSADTMRIEDYLAFYDTESAWIRSTFPEWEICLAPLSPNDQMEKWLNDPRWQARGANADYIGANAYYRTKGKEMQEAGDQIWRVHQAFPNKRVLWLEFCCTAGEGGFPRDPDTLCDEYKNVICWAKGQDWIAALFVFMLGNADPGDGPDWTAMGETLTPKLARALGSIALEQEETLVKPIEEIKPLEFEGAFAGYATEHPEIGAPKSKLNYIAPNPGSKQLPVQFAENALLVFNEEAQEVKSIPFE
jgi:hypothetical protein